MTRRYWAAVGTAVALAGLAVLLDRAVLLWGTAAVGGWVLARQVAFRRAARTSTDSLTTALLPDRVRVRADTSVAVSLVARLDEPAGHPVTVEARSPTGATGGAGATATIPRGEREASATYECAFPFSGRHALPRPTVTVTDAGGLFEATETVGVTAEIVVDPRRPRAVHVGQGGEAIAATYGDHRAGPAGAGTVPSEVRRYVPGDDVRHIDWAATARLDEVYVREFEAETDRTTAIVVDAGPHMGTGPPGETKLDYGVHVALTLLEVAADHRDPAGLFTVAEDGDLRWDRPAATAAQYAAIRDRLRALETGDGHGDPSAEPPRRRPTGGRRRALLADGSPFAQVLRPLLSRPRERRRRAGDAPLVETARVLLSELGGTVWTAIVTDDTDRPAVVDAVRAARRGNDRVTVFLLPDVLFEPGGLADLESAYERYRDFETFRRGLSRMDRVTALEVGPADRVEAILGTRRRGVSGP